MLTTEDLQALAKIIDERLEKKLQPIKDDISAMKMDIAVMKEDIEDIKESAEEVRGATNELIDWFDTYHRDSSTPFPVDRKTFLSNLSS